MRRLLLLPLLFILAVPTASAQPATAPSIIAAEQGFERGLRALHAQQYGAAYDAFNRVATQYEYHQRTTAAQLMAGRALLAMGDFQAAASAMTSFIARYPRSRYVVEARRLRREAMDRMRDRPVVPEVTSLGVVLPLAAQDAAFSQALFNGIRLAVDEHNQAHPDRPIRMVFRETGGTASAAADALAELARAGVGAVVGPLYSEEAIASAAVAEREGLVLVAPLATDDQVSEGRRYVFQANPTFPVRGRAMARYALESGYEAVGVAAVEGTLAEEMAVAFRREFERSGRSLQLDERLPRGEAWFQLPELLGTDRVSALDAVYFPITGANADQLAAGAIRVLDLMLGDQTTTPRVLANSEWQNLGASRSLAEQFGTVFTNDFFLGRETPELRAFTNQYLDLAGVLPDRLAFKGYDVTRLLLARLAEGKRGRALADELRAMPPYSGLAHRIEFGGTQVNQHLHLVLFRGGDVVPAR